MAREEAWRARAVHHPRHRPVGRAEGVCAVAAGASVFPRIDEVADHCSVIAVVQLPHQDNSSDCGLFLLKYAELVLGKANQLCALGPDHFDDLAHAADVIVSILSPAPRPADMAGVRAYLKQVGWLPGMLAMRPWVHAC